MSVHLSKYIKIALSNFLKPLIILLCLVCSCTSQKRYVGNDYSFYSKNFKLDSAAFLRTDGVYILDRTETDGTNETKKVHHDKKIYKFYPNGQVNMVLDSANELKSDDDYMKAFNSKINASSITKNATLFEGYYRIQGNRMVIQFVNQPLRQFYYTYVYLAEKQMIIVKTTHVGRGKIKERYYNSSYKEPYRFKQTHVDGYLPPDW